MGLSSIPEGSRLYEESWYHSIIEPPKLLRYEQYMSV